MTMKKIGHNLLLSNMASLALAVKMENQTIPGEAYLSNQMSAQIEEAKSYNEKALSIASWVLNAFLWGQDYQKSVESDNLRRDKE